MDANEMAGFFFFSSVKTLFPVRSLVVSDPLKAQRKTWRASLSSCPTAMLSPRQFAETHVGTGAESLAALIPVQTSWKRRDARTTGETQSLRLLGQSRDHRRRGANRPQRNGTFILRSQVHPPELGTRKEWKRIGVRLSLRAMSRSTGVRTPEHLRVTVMQAEKSPDLERSGTCREL